MEDVSSAFREKLTKRIKKTTSLVSGLALGFAFPGGNYCNFYCNKYIPSK